MSLTTAERLARQSTQWPWEVVDGQPRRLGFDHARRRDVAARIARRFEPAAIAAGGWVSTEIVVRIARRPETALRPLLAVMTTEPPYDGVVDDPPLLVVDVGDARRALWPSGAAGTVLTVLPDGVAIDRAGAPPASVAPGEWLSLAGLAALKLKASALCEFAPRPSNRDGQRCAPIPGRR